MAGSRGSYLQELGVDLELGGGAALLLGGLPSLLDALEQVVDGSRDDAQVLVGDVEVEARPHGVRLPRARLQEQEEEQTVQGESERVHDPTVSALTFDLSGTSFSKTTSIHRMVEGKFSFVAFFN